MIIEDIPITAVRDPPEGLKTFAQANTVKNAKVPMPTYVGSNTQFLSIPMQMFNLRGQGNSCKVEVEPAYASFQGDKFINHKYEKTIHLKKHSEGQVRYKLRAEGKSRETFQVDVIAQGVSMNRSGGVIEGVIDANDEKIELKLNVMSTQRGDDMAYFLIEIEDGAPISFQVAASFKGPIIKCHTPIIDFGLVKVNSIEHYEIVLENTSPIQAEVLIKSATNERLNFDNMISSQEHSRKMDR